MGGKSNTPMKGVVKLIFLVYAWTMTNREWYAQVIQFCRLSERCSTCPFHLLTNQPDPPDDQERPCFASKEALLALDAWLSQEHGKITGEEEEAEAEDDHQWLKELLKVQFHQDEDDDEFFCEEDFI